MDKKLLKLYGDYLYLKNTEISLKVQSLILKIIEELGEGHAQLLHLLNVSLKKELIGLI